ncbi:Uncharacterised protein [uncultured archaeon]|nr:Uncharacterised protein [uncultured archaeon]
MHRLACIALLLAQISIASGVPWFGLVPTYSDGRVLQESRNMSFSFEQNVTGQIAPVAYRGRTLSPYHSAYEDVLLDEVRLKERTSAREGRIRSEELLKLFSGANSSQDAAVYKPEESDIFAIDSYENLPVKIDYTKSMNYSGIGINDRDSIGSSRDFIGSSFLYNHEFSKKQILSSKLDRLNITDEAAQPMQIKVTRDTQHNLKTHSTGIASFKYLQVDANGDILNEGDERYVGTYDLAKNLRMKSQYNLIRKNDDWLPCCSGGFESMNLMDQKPFKSAKGVFDCSCFVVPAKAQFQR